MRLPVNSRKAEVGRGRADLQWWITLYRGWGVVAGPMLWLLPLRDQANQRKPKENRRYNRARAKSAAFVFSKKVCRQHLVSPCRFAPEDRGSGVDVPLNKILAVAGEAG